MVVAPVRKVVEDAAGAAVDLEEAEEQELARLGPDLP